MNAKVQLLTCVVGNKVLPGETITASLLAISNAVEVLPQRLQIGSACMVSILVQIRKFTYFLTKFLSPKLTACQQAKPAADIFRTGT